MQDYFTTAKT